MAETKIEMKVDEEVKALKELCDKFVKMTMAELDKGIENISTHEMYEVADIIKDLAEAKKDTVEACYKKYILGAMENHEDEYDETWDEEGVKYYPMRSKVTGRYIKRYPEPEVHMPMSDRDMDMSKGKMYYTEPMTQDYREGKTGKMRKMYMESKQMHNDTSANMNNLEKWVKTFITELKDKEVWDKMTQPEKNMTKQLLQTAINEM